MPHHLSTFSGYPSLFACPLEQAIERRVKEPKPLAPPGRDGLGTRCAYVQSWGLRPRRPVASAPVVVFATAEFHSCYLDKVGQRESFHEPWIIGSLPRARWHRASACHHVWLIAAGSRSVVDE